MKHKRSRRHAPALRLSPGARSAVDWLTAYGATHPAEQVRPRDFPDAVLAVLRADADEERAGCLAWATLYLARGPEGSAEESELEAMAERFGLACTLERLHRAGFLDVKDQRGNVFDGGASYQIATGPKSAPLVDAMRRARTTPWN